MLPWLQPYQQQLQQQLVTNNLAHAILLSGPDGIGKITLAHWLAATLLCKAGIAERPCGQCKSCLLRQAGNHPDLFEPDISGQSIGVEVVRQITHFLQGTAQQHGARVVLIRYADLMTEAAANALLKTLEEPPQNSYIVLQSARPMLLPATILSRCQHWKLAAVFDQQAKHWLEQHTNRPLPDFLLDYTAGGPLNALQLLESGQADRIQLLQQQLQQFFYGSQPLAELVKQLESFDDASRLLGWFIRYHLQPQLIMQQATQAYQLSECYARWCRNEQQIAGQNKTLALHALLLEIKRMLSGKPAETHAAPMKTR
ncbi:DNA polymerase III subunit delta' [Chromatiaceae bacterium AAb-1]|nr:DNA polymerase III subunit delta' [Chromatiaceae bacterium AAb-1]